MKVLVINTQSINHDNATGITLRSLFCSFPENDILEIYMQTCLPAKDKLSLNSIQAGFCECPIRYLSNKIFKRKSNAGVSISAKTNTSSLKSRILGRMIMMIDFMPVFASQRIRKKISSFQPECIYTMGNAVDAMKLAYKISEKFNIPIVPHFMDNWQDSHRYGRERYPLHLKKTQKWLKKIYSKSFYALTISKKMAIAYDEKWGKSHYPLMNAVNGEAFSCEDKRRDKLIITYAGGLHLNRYKSLLQIADSIDTINANKNVNVCFEIYTDNNSMNLYRSVLEEKACVRIMPYVPHDRIKGIYEKSSVLVHIETFDTDYRDFIRYSLSTKISEYLFSKRPILLFAPSDICVSEYLTENKAAMVVSDSCELLNALEKVLFDESFCNELCSNSYKLAYENHSFESSKKTIEYVFLKSIEENRGVD